DVSPRFRVGTSLSFTRAARNAPSVENGSLGNSANGIQAAMEFAPFQAPRDAAGAWIKTSPSTEPVPNPIANATDLTDLNTTSRLLGSAFGELDVTSSLRVRTTFGGNFQFDGTHNFALRSIIAGGVPGANHKWALFPSAAFAWRLGDETFMQHQSLFNDVKLRVSYGTVGNQAVSPYQSLAGLSTRWYSFGSTEFPALSPSTTMPNPD